MRFAWTVFFYFQKGMALLYNGQEWEAIHRPSLFDKDDIDWPVLPGCGYFENYLARLAEIKKHALFTDSRYEVKRLPRDVLVATHRKGDRQLIGVFYMGGSHTVAPVRVDVPDGQYTNLLELDPDGPLVEVCEGMAACYSRASCGLPFIFEAPCS